MATKKTLRNTGHFVAVDIIDEHKVIQATPILLARNQPYILKWRDVEENKYVSTSVVFDGSKLVCIDGDGIQWNSPVDELLTEVKI